MPASVSAAMTDGNPVSPRPGNGMQSICVAAESDQDQFSETHVLSRLPSEFLIRCWILVPGPGGFLELLLTCGPQDNTFPPLHPDSSSLSVRKSSSIRPLRPLFRPQFLSDFSDSQRNLKIGQPANFKRLLRRANCFVVDRAISPLQIKTQANSSDDLRSTRLSESPVAPVSATIDLKNSRAKETIR